MSNCRLAFAFTLCLLGNSALAADPKTLFDKSVRPLLERKCYECHSAKADEVKGNLRLDSLEGILKGGDNGPAVIAGDIENSFLLRAIRYQEDDYQMPPSGKLPDGDIAAVEAWVKALEDAVKRTKNENGRCALEPSARASGEPRSRSHQTQIPFSVA
jgi:hypothetical protein